MDSFAAAVAAAQAADYAVLFLGLDQTQEAEVSADGITRTSACLRDGTGRVSTATSSRCLACRTSWPRLVNLCIPFDVSRCLICRRLLQPTPTRWWC